MLGSRGRHTEVYWRYQCKRLIDEYDKLSPVCSKLTQEERLKMFEHIDGLDKKEAQMCKKELEKEFHKRLQSIRRKNRIFDGMKEGERNV